MLRIGLTGSIATGKTTVLEVFAALGVPVYSADTAVHELYSGEAVPAIETLFPGVARNGVVDRAELSRRIAAAPERLAELESVVHPLVREKTFAFFDAAEAEGADMAVAEVPLLFEASTKYPLDRIVVTHCDPEIQNQRIMARPGMTAEKRAMVLSRQIPQAEKVARADHVIETSGTLEETREQTRALVAALRARGE